jgi:hypothetical protein
MVCTHYGDQEARWLLPSVVVVLHPDAHSTVKCSICRVVHQRHARQGTVRAQRDYDGTPNPAASARPYPGLLRQPHAQPRVVRTQGDPPSDAQCSGVTPS